MSENREKVKALILSGGGVRGTFQYGAIDYIYNHVLTEGERFKIVCGVSAGAMNGSIIAQHRFEEGKRFWMDQIEKGVPALGMRFTTLHLILYAVLPGIFTLCQLKKTPSVGINRGVREILEETCANLVSELESSDTYLRLGVVDYQTGAYVSIDPTTEPYRNRVVDAILASTTIPVAFPAVEMKKHQFFDGGVINITPFKDILDIVKEPKFQSRYELEDIYSVLCSPLETKETHQEYRGLIDIALRTLDILMKEIYNNDLKVFEKVNALVWLTEKMRGLVNNESELEPVFKAIKDETGVDVTKYSPMSNKTIAPKPAEWLNYVDSEYFPTDVAKPADLTSDSEQLFWENWPQTLTKDIDQLKMCYHFGRYMAHQAFSPKA